MRERVDIVGGVCLAVAEDIFDHLPPHAGIALDREINLLWIDRFDFTDIPQLKDLELQDEVARLAVVSDSHAKLGIDKAEATKSLLIRGHLFLKRREILRRGKTDCHSEVS